MKFDKLVEFVSKKPIPSHTNHLIVEIMASDEEGEDVEVGFSFSSSVSLWLNQHSIQVPFIVVKI